MRNTRFGSHSATGRYTLGEAAVRGRLCDNQFRRSGGCFHALWAGPAEALLVGPAGLRVPACGTPVIIKVDAVPDTAGIAREEFVIPCFVAGRQFLQALGVAEPADQLILRECADTVLELIDPGMTARQEREQEAARKKEGQSQEACHRHNRQERTV